MMYRYSQLGILLSATMALSFAACKKDEAKKEAPAVEAPVAKVPVAPEEKPTAPVEAAELADYFYVEISHAEPKEGDPIKVSFPGLSVASASFDANNLEGATAQIEIDLSRIDSGVPKRDGHLGTPDYLDTAKHPKAVITIRDVEKKDNSTYLATADISVHGINKVWPVQFRVVDTTAAGLVIEAEHSFSRLDFEIGKVADDPAADDVVAKLRITLQNS